MKRYIADKLLTWKNQPRRKPLIVRGARQVGKTWSVMDFGKTHFPGIIHRVDLEQHPDWHRIFQGNLVASRIISELELLLNARITPGQDLLFFDEIQSCPRAIMALRYFFEECPDLHVIAAGSLLEFAMRDISFPVGRIQFLTLYPMCFAEFLHATGKNLAAQIILSPPAPQPDTVHEMLLEELRRYFFIGGMPECVLAYSKTEKIRDAFEVQAEIIHSYRQDFAKYSPYTDRQCLNTVLSSAAQHVGRQIKYTHLAEGYSVPTIKKALESLCLAKVLLKIPSANPAGLPLGASASLKKFKSLLVDIGLLQSLCGMPVDMEFSRPDLLDIYQGALAEQFVGQELLASGQEELYYWAREARGSTAEVDFLAVFQGKIYPVEVKSGRSGRLKSLHLFLQSYPNSPTGLVFSTAPFSMLPEQKITFLPAYFAYSAHYRGQE